MLGNALQHMICPAGHVPGKDDRFEPVPFALHGNAWRIIDMDVDVEGGRILGTMPARSLQGPVVDLQVDDLVWPDTIREKGPPDAVYGAQGAGIDVYLMALALQRFHKAGGPQPERFHARNSLKQRSLFNIKFLCPGYQGIIKVEGNDHKD